jgi:hypothetical protein
MDDSFYDCCEDCEHSDVDGDDVCMLCGLDMGRNKLKTEKSISQHFLPRPNNIDRRLLNFRTIMNRKSGKQPFRLKPKEEKIINDVINFLYPTGDYNERKVKDVLKKLKLYKYINDSNLIYCLLKNIECVKFDEYESYFEYIYVKMFNYYSKLYPYKYFISGAFILSKLLNEVGIDSDYRFKNIDTYNEQNRIYKIIRGSLISPCGENDGIFIDYNFYTGVKK